MIDFMFRKITFFIWVNVSGCLINNYTLLPAQGRMADENSCLFVYFVCIMRVEKLDLQEWNPLYYTTSTLAHCYNNLQMRKRLLPRVLIMTHYIQHFIDLLLMLPIVI